jgi:hypothetical protein
MLEFKVVEASTVTDEELTRIINDWVAQGWAYDGMQFAMRESSKRPAMAFVTFTRGEADGSGGAKVLPLHRRPRKKDRAP